MKKILLGSWLVLAIGLNMQAMESDSAAAAAAATPGALDTTKLPLVPYTERKAWKQLSWLRQEITNLESTKNKELSVEEKIDIKAAIVRGAILRGSILGMTYPQNKKEIHECVQTIWLTLPETQRELVSNELYGLADEFRSGKKSAYELVVQAAHRKIENGKVKTRKGQEKKVLEEQLETVEHQVLELIKQQRAIQAALGETKAQAQLIRFVGTYLTSQQQTHLATTEEKIQVAETAIRQAATSLEELSAQLAKEKDTTRRTDIQTQIATQKELKALREKELQELQETKKKMIKRIGRDTYTWTDSFPFSMFSSRK
jgi:hypothetical protein